jgi:hypothetical protein
LDTKKREIAGGQSTGNVQAIEIKEGRGILAATNG